ncbi:MAG: Crp/Fnr family transcriptional regulator [Chloroflexia bacterium]|nr:Crp/Fnr family transcriptional regulator [Chloroflexia bacterium]
MCFVPNTDQACYLQTTELFQDLSPEELAELEQRMPQTTIETGRLIYSPNERGEVLFILKEGRVRLYRLSPDGKALTTAILEPKAVFGEMALLGQGMHESFAEAIETSIVCTLNRREVHDLLLTEPRVAQRLIELIGRRLVETERKLEDFAFKSVPERLAAILLQLGHVSATETGTVVLANRYTHQQLAEMIGTYRETVTKTLNDFRTQGLIRTDRGKIKLLDLEGLRRV